MNFTCGCLFDRSMKEPHFKKSKHFQDLAASFAINAKGEQLGAHYSWLVEIHKPMGVSAPYVEATLENPQDRSQPLHVPAVQVQNNDPTQQFAHPRYYVLSPALPKLDCGLYKMKLTAYTDKSKTVKLAEHENELLSRVNTDTCYKTEFMERMNAAARYAEKEWETRQ
ncbi:uncharacterized protein BYT42DRAFT_617173 [Radiomyces spectabilis]|uniref:uncharacterized protein n=1 Tax=Radiomyces spectabilis TaxID=64574 RepID=UPI002220A018|nr:uncharacterized protein BYT42DRAFT_617173 [Radiomyces spectabilis]KAI8370636.1 hypothetical protein BYT42DRAFT_617173 [Radiomyces spectabilis]